MHEIVRSGGTPGLLAYDGDVPVGWVAVAPRTEFGQLVRSRAYGPGPTEEAHAVWSVVCFYVDSRAKKRGVAHALLSAAVDHAFEQGAAVIEGYPHENGDYMGSPAMFAAAGFEPVRPAGKRLVMQRRART
jgi:GNAT superfamily N-acetyltransferase